MDYKGAKEKAFFEVIEFRLDDRYYGVTTDIVKEIVLFQTLTPAPNTHPAVEGIFMPRDKMITAIDLKNCLQMGSSSENGLFIIATIDGTEMAFHIDNVIAIHKVAEEEITLAGFSVEKDTSIQGVIKKGNKLIILLDLEELVRSMNLTNVQGGID